MHDFETALPALHAVIEGRSVHSTAVYQSLIAEPDDDEKAFALAGRILDGAALWRPLPDLTIVLTDDVDAAVGRAEERNGEQFTDEQWVLHRRAATLFERLAAADPGYVRLLDRRDPDTDTLVGTITALLADAASRPFSGLVPPTVLP
jgi:dTMP kinase